MTTWHNTDTFGGRLKRYLFFFLKIVGLFVVLCIAMVIGLHVSASKRDRFYEQVDQQIALASTRSWEGRILPPPTTYNAQPIIYSSPAGAGLRWLPVAKAIQAAQSYLQNQKFAAVTDISIEGYSVKDVHKVLDAASGLRFLDTVTMTHVDCCNEDVSHLSGLHKVEFLTFVECKIDASTINAISSLPIHKLTFEACEFEPNAIEPFSKLGHVHWIKMGFKLPVERLTEIRKSIPQTYVTR